MGRQYIKMMSANIHIYTRVIIITADAPFQGQTGLGPQTKTNFTNTLSFSMPASAVEFRLVPVLTHLLSPIGTFVHFHPVKSLPVCDSMRSQ